MDIIERINQYKQKPMPLAVLKSIVNDPPPVELGVGKIDDGEHVVIKLYEDKLVIATIGETGETSTVITDDVDPEKLPIDGCRFYRNRVHRKFGLWMEMSGNPIRSIGRANTEKFRTEFDDHA